MNNVPSTINGNSGGINSAYQKLQHHFKKINDLQHIAAMTEWDEASMMPVGGGEARAEAMSTLKVMIHQLITEPRVGDWINGARAGAALSNWETANLREIDRTYQEATCIPDDLIAANTKARAKCEQAWRVHRANNDWAAMEPLLTEVVLLTREEASYRSESTGLGLYDAMLDLYEPGVTSAQIDTIFADLKSFLPGFADSVIHQQSKDKVLPISGYFSDAKQKKLSVALMSSIGFDFKHGRLDVSHHPFCNGVPDDVRITTRYATSSFISSMMSVLHETGHAIYEQGLPQDWRNQPVGKALSTGTHESQSLLIEMQACRTEEFMQFITPIIQRIFLGSETNDQAWCVNNLHKLYTRVQKSLIRVDADEVTYPLHVILRYEIEKALINGTLQIIDLPTAWNEKMHDLLEAVHNLLNNSARKAKGVN
ncbi:MAG: carboxypeptidase M32 [Endozoicomonas sp. (ex Botrylloides leachii)]|nr:carboxypeptidase M32 [Endozoicomonas sp. (ex Botrylloides leachii)]